MYTADAGRCGLGLTEGRMMVPRGKMLGGSSALNYMAYVRGHPGDFDNWAQGGAVGWSYAATLWLALVYLGEHYAVDLIGGAALAEAVRTTLPRLAPLYRRVSAAMQALESRAAQ